MIRLARIACMHYALSVMMDIGRILVCGGSRSFACERIVTFAPCSFSRTLARAHNMFVISILERRSHTPHMCGVRKTTP